jgi:hypothetical protein
VHSEEATTTYVEVFGLMQRRFELAIFRAQFYQKDAELRVVRNSDNWLVVEVLILMIKSLSTENSLCG